MLVKIYRQVIYYRARRARECNDKKWQRSNKNVTATTTCYVR